jgi:hypothetical protein
MMRDISRLHIACAIVVLLSTFFAGMSIARMSPQLADADAGMNHDLDDRDTKRISPRALALYQQKNTRHRVHLQVTDDGADDVALGLKVIGNAAATMPNFAFATAVLSDDYVPGACVLAYSLFRTGTPHRMAALVFNDLRADRRCVLVSIRCTSASSKVALNFPTPFAG